MKNPHKGAIIITGLTAPPEKHEYNTAKYFAERGFDVTFIPPRHIKGVPNPDFIMAGKIWETKSLLTSETATLKRRLNQAAKQSQNIIIDLRRMNVRYENDLLRQINKEKESRSIKTLLVITHDGRLLTIKGKFSNIMI